MTYWYQTLKALTHEELDEMINSAVTQGWEPFQCWAAAFGPNIATHYCMLRRPR